MKAKLSIARADIIRLLLTASLVLAYLFTTSCGEHSWVEEMQFGSSSSLGQSNNSEQHSGIIVGPLLQTKWAQRSPYNDLFPMVDGERMVTDCGTTAWVQIMAFHKYPPRGKGESSNVGPGEHPVQLTSLDVAYDWDNMLNEYTSANPGTEQQRLAVATLMYHYGLARSVNSINSLVINFGYDKSYRRLFHEYYSDAEWEAILRKQLDLGLPVYYYGSSVANDDEDNFSVESGHTFVVDGYDNAGKFHFNWGWSGSYDGWHSLNDIDAGQGRRYNYNNIMGINVKPDAGSIGSNEMGLNDFTASKTTVPQSEQVTVVAKIRSEGFFPGGQAGVALVNNSGNIVEVIGMINYNAMNPNATRTSTINCYVSNSVAPGQYNLRFVTKMNGEDWKIVARSLPDVPKSIPFTVTEETGIKGGGYGLTLRRFEIYPDVNKTTVSINEEFTVDHSLSDLSSTTYPGNTSGVALVDNNNNLVAILGTLDIPPIADSNRAVGKKIKCKVPSTVAPGKYKLRIVVKTSGNTEWRVVTQIDGNLPTFIDFTVL